MPPARGAIVVGTVILIFPTRKFTRLRRRIGLQVKLFLLNLYVVGLVSLNLRLLRIGLQVKLGKGESERERKE